MTPSRSLLLLSLAWVAMPAFAAENISKVNGAVTAQAGQRYGSLETVNGSINIGTGAQVENAETVNGGITVGDRAITGSLETVNGGVKAGEQVQVRGDVETVNGGIFLDRGSQVRDGVSTVNGGIGLVGTRVGGGIETVSGDITVGVDSQVKGGIKVEKPNGNFSFGNQRPPRVVIGPHAVVEGPLVFEREVTLHVHSSARIGPVTGATALPFSTPTAPND